MEKTATAVTAIELFKSDCFPETAAWTRFCKRYAKSDKGDLVTIVDFISSEYCIDKKSIKKEVERELKEAIRITGEQTE